MAFNQLSQSKSYYYCFFPITKLPTPFFTLSRKNKKRTRYHTYFSNIRVSVGFLS